MSEVSKTTWQTYAYLFQILSRGLTCPDDVMSKDIADGSFCFEVKEALYSCTFYNKTTRKSINSNLDKVDSWKHESTLLSVLRQEYTKLFSAPRGALVSIWETLFVDPERTSTEFGATLIRSKEAVDALKRYEAVGLNMAFQESADHMRIECEFVGFLCAQLGSAESEDAQMMWLNHLDGFTNMHLKRWLVPFFEQMKQEACHPFYQVIASLGCSIDLAEFEL